MSLGHVLVIRPGALGDAVLTLPALAALHASGSESLTVLGTPSSWAFLKRNELEPWIEDFGSHEWLGLFADGADMPERVSKLLNRISTAIVYLSGDTSGIERRLKSFGIERVLVIAPPVASPAQPSANSEPRLTECKWSALTPQHASRQLADPLAAIVAPAAINGAFDPARIRELQWFKPTSEEYERCEGILSEIKFRSPIALHPGSGGRRKCWSAARFAQLADRVSGWDFVPLVFFGPADDDVEREFTAAISLERAWRPIKNFPLRVVLALLGQCEFYIGNDSGMTHLAAQVTKVLAIFGPTDPDVWMPVGSRDRVLQAPFGDLNALTVEDACDAIECERVADFRSPTPEPPSDNVCNYE